MLLECAVLVAAAAAVTCPSVICGVSPNATCVQTTASSLLLSPCPDHSTCPAFSPYALNSTACVAERTHAPEPRQCLRYYEEQQLCDLNRPCDKGNYCHQPDNRCKKRQRLGYACTDLWECEAGAVCNKGLCVEYFSVLDGGLSDSRIACMSAIVKRGICAPEVKSKTALPISCTTDDDCQATDQSFGTCNCAFSNQTTGYCSLHPSDEPVKKVLIALHDGKVELASYLHKRLATFPRAEMAEECVRHHDESLKSMETLKEWSGRCWSVALQVASLLVLALD
jgi:hypothetical protein